MCTSKPGLEQRAPPDVRQLPGWQRCWHLLPTMFQENESAVVLAGVDLILRSLCLTARRGHRFQNKSHETGVRVKETRAISEKRRRHLQNLPVPCFRTPCWDTCGILMISMKIGERKERRNTPATHDWQLSTFPGTNTAFILKRSRFKVKSRMVEN